MPAAITLAAEGNELDKLIDSYGIGWYQIIVLLMCGACVIADGAEMLGALRGMLHMS